MRAWRYSTDLAYHSTGPGGSRLLLMAVVSFSLYRIWARLRLLLGRISALTINVAGVTVTGLFVKSANFGF